MTPGLFWEILSNPLILRPGGRGEDMWGGVAHYFPEASILYAQYFPFTFIEFQSSWPLTTDLNNSNNNSNHS